MRSNELKRMDVGSSNGDPTDEDLRAAAELHLKIADFANHLIDSGTPPFVVANAMISLGAAALVKTHGHVQARFALLSCYGPIKAASEQDAATKQ